jgi:hypothetical protein
VKLSCLRANFNQFSITRKATAGFSRGVLPSSQNLSFSLNRTFYREENQVRKGNNNSNNSDVPYLSKIQRLIAVTNFRALALRSKIRSVVIMQMILKV